MNPKVSIIIPNYNHEFFLYQRIETVLNQTFSNFELILLDDSSTDNSLQILDKYSSHPKVSSIVRNSVNSGSVFKQWIKGINLCRGEYIWIAESDDFASETFLDETIKVIEQSSNIGLVFTNSFMVDENNKELGLITDKKGFDELSKQNNSIDISNLSEFLLEKLLILNVSSVLFRKSALIEVNFDELGKYKNAGDVFTYLSIAIHHKIIYYPKPLNYFRQHQKRTTNTNFKNGVLHYEKLKLLDYFLDKIYLNEIENKKNSIVNYYYNLFLPCLDLNYSKKLKKNLKRILNYNFISKTRYLQLFCIISFYKIITNNGKFYFMRNLIKKLLI